MMSRDSRDKRPPAYAVMLADPRELVSGKRTIEGREGDEIADGSQIVGQIYGVPIYQFIPDEISDDMALLCCGSYLQRLNDIQMMMSFYIYNIEIEYENEELRGSDGPLSGKHAIKGLNRLRKRLERLCKNMANDIFYFEIAERRIREEQKQPRLLFE